MNKLIFRMACLTAVLYPALAGRAGEPQYANPKDVTQLWAGYDPRALPLDIEVTHAWESDGARFQRVYFTGEISEGVPVRVFAITGVPAGDDKRPGILHLHGGGQTASEAWVRFWVQRGYAAVSLDWLGKYADRTDYTRWGRVKANMMLDGQARTTRPSVRMSPWYHWALVSRRALTLLESLPGVDRERLGLFGVSMGAQLTWVVAGSDSRVRTAVPIYGCGWNTYPDVHSGGGYTHPVPPEIDLWRATMEPETYARYITCPVLQLSATNDFHANMDRSYDSLLRVNALTRQSLTLRYSHHLEPPQGRTLERWMEWQLKGGPAWAEAPSVRAEALDGEVEAIIQADKAQEVERVEAFYALGNKRPQTRFWRTAEVRQDTGLWRARLPIMDADQTLRAFTNVTYRGGYTLTSSLAVVIPSALGPVRATDRPSLLVDDFSHGVEDWTFGPAYTDPYLNWSYLVPAKGPEEGSAALSLNPVAWGSGPIHYVVGTHKVGDPKWAAPAGARLAFQYQGESPGTLEVHVLVDQWGPKARTYTAAIPLSETSDWQRIRVEAGQCVTKEGAGLTDFRLADRIDFVGASPPGKPPRFARVEWVPSE